MIKVRDYGDVRQFILARSFFGRTLYQTCAYWVDGLLIDTGCVYTIGELAAALEDFPVNLIVNTHAHEDHFGANAFLQRDRGVPVFAHSDALPILERPDQLGLKPYQRFVWGLPQPVSGIPLGNVVETDQFRFRVIHTPGHCPNHICLFEPDRGWLFTGDAFVGGRDKALRADYDIWGIIGSLEKLAEISPGNMFTGSGSVRKNAQADLAEKIGFLKETGDRVLELDARGLSQKEIRNKLFGPEKLIRYITQGHFSGVNLVRSYIQDRPGG